MVRPSPPPVRTHTHKHKWVHIILYSSSHPVFMAFTSLHVKTTIIVCMSRPSSSTLGYGWLLCSSPSLFMSVCRVRSETHSSLTFGRLARAFFHLFFCVQNYQYTGSFCKTSRVLVILYTQLRRNILGLVFIIILIPPSRFLPYILHSWRYGLLLVSGLRAGSIPDST